MQLLENYYNLDIDNLDLYEKQTKTFKFTKTIVLRASYRNDLANISN